MFKKQSIRNYFHINRFNVIGTILLLPFLVLLGIDFLGRLIQGDFMHYNRAFYNVVSHTILYGSYNGQVPFLWTILILFPILAVVFNLIPFVISLKQSKKSTFETLFFANPLAVIIIGIGFFSLVVVFGHDVIPCFVYGILSHGLGNIGRIISFCKNA